VSPYRTPAVVVAFDPEPEAPPEPNPNLYGEYGIPHGRRCVRCRTPILPFEDDFMDHYSFAEYFRWRHHCLPCQAEIPIDLKSVGK